ncbi:N-methylhydantoinase B (hyuB) [Pyrobaculum aerophilum str. IM2]|uniref:N-methylhydantoinase B (HyuB) n=1 Tax=Pyrobaculum aerophilum (strain ATCC 51768 / DSM 7523 / JCM 9630 / CIP 104966 / NBRC 100827 / IM2) TaxID=178306 RepID=Q8ZW11_PYRAE|nr:hydantoinase B/oxoprolinase family protein [Pyrobaculum aerophilum]AAL63893.1 N-methylhydantoinase B (hyuB) [Pyrobaculum aerophilum str. IM2]
MRWELIYRATVYIAEEAGIALRNSAFSPNIRERMDHSVAVLNASGEIVAQAEHIPVHLGSFYVGVKNLFNALREAGVELEEGDVVALNDPYISGTHLNDVMVVTPVFWRGRLVAYIVNKAHHVDVGGPVPGSINPSAKTIYEEGFVLPPVKIIKRGEVNKEALSIWLSNVKTPEATIGDLNAQIAANRVGTRRIVELFDKYGALVEEAWKRAIEYGRLMTQSEISKWPRGVYVAEDYLELGDKFLKIAVRLTIGECVEANYSGTDPQVDAPLNAVLGVTYAATSFPIRCLIRGDVPINEGFYSCISVKAPEGSLLNPKRPAAVAGGNLETSQRTADAVFKALAEAMPDKVPAAGSGTMMNVMMGGVYQGKYWSYYETIGGGTGGRPGKHGVSGVHVNMTNTLNTPIEIAERTYPLLFTAYRIREGSGGRGKWRGGDGIVRAFKVLAPTRLAILADRFKIGPWGIQGGEAGKPGRAYVKKAGGRTIQLDSKTITDLEPGDEVVIETPGGGGWGPHNF